MRLYMLMFAVEMVNAPHSPPSVRYSNNVVISCLGLAPQYSDTRPFSNLFIFRQIFSFSSMQLFSDVDTRDYPSRCLYPTTIYGA